VCFEQKKRKEHFTLFGRTKDNRQKFFKYFRMGILKFENFKELLLTDNQKKNTQWRRSIKTLERLALALRLVNILYNLLFPSSSEQLNTSQKASSILANNLCECSYSYQKNRTWAGCPQAVERRLMLIHTSHAVPSCFCAMALRSHFQRGVVRGQQGRSLGMVWYV
jgi:hypothetical protein